MKDQLENAQSSLAQSFQSLFNIEELLAKVIEYFPYPIQVYSPDGISVLVNKALLAEYHATNPDVVVGKYNIFEDPAVISTGQLPMIKRAFQGETVFFHNIRVPLEIIAERYDIKDFDVKVVYQDITVFPILDDMNQVIYVAAILINRRVYYGNDEIEKAKEYIETHWMEKLELDKMAKAACLSKSHFTKLFKKHTGVTPHDYYNNYKISKLKENLLNTNLSISQAFAACNMDYNGHSAKLFKKKAGVSPSIYRKMSQ